MKRMIAARRTSRAFGRGDIEFLRPANPAVLAYLRRYRGETLLVVNNLSAHVQPVELVAGVAHVGEVAQATDVDDDRRRREAELHERDE